MFTRVARLDYKNRSYAVALSEIKHIKMETTEKPFSLKVVVTFLGDGFPDSIEITETKKEHAKALLELYYDMVTRWSNFAGDLEEFVTK